jgi:hypothetical protein
MTEPARESRQEKEPGDPVRGFFIVTPARGSLKWLPIKGYGLTTSRGRVPTMNQEEACDIEINGEKSE